MSADGSDEADAPRRRGRPPGKRGTFAFRVTSTLRAQLEAAAAQSGKSISEEIELRLEQSFWTEAIKANEKDEFERFSPDAYIRRMSIMCGGDEGLNFAMALGDHMKMVRKKHGIKPDVDIADLPEEQRLELAKDFASVLRVRFGLWNLEEGDGGNRLFEVLTGSGRLKINPPKAED